MTTTSMNLMLLLRAFRNRSSDVRMVVKLSRPTNCAVGLKPSQSVTE
jgi:hypothetical protein